MRVSEASGATTEMGADQTFRPPAKFRPEMCYRADMQTQPASEYARLLHSRFARVEGQEIADNVIEELCSILAMEHGVEASISNDLEHVANVYALGKARSQGEKRSSEEKRVLLQIARHEAKAAELWDKLGHEAEIRLLRDLERYHASDSVTPDDPSQVAARVVHLVDPARKVGPYAEHGAALADAG